jgi:predicted metalloenzyme YecM
MVNPIKNILGPPESFLQEIFKNLEADAANVSKSILDHICYRVETYDRYLFLKNQLLAIGTLLTESEIGGRPIASFKLFEPIVFEGRNIGVIELPAPKTGSFYPEGYEHAEFVIDVDFETFIKNHPHIKFDKRAINKTINPEIIIKYGELSVKFHHHTLEYVIEFLD